MYIRKIKVGETVTYRKSWDTGDAKKSGKGTVIAVSKTIAVLDNGDIVSQRTVKGFNVLASMYADYERTRAGFDLDYLVPMLNGKEV